MSAGRVGVMRSRREVHRGDALRIEKKRLETATLAPWFDVNNTIGEPSGWRMRAGLGWAQNGLTSRLLPGQNAIPFDGTNASAVGRLISIQVTKEW